jgi:D-glycero-D-manno-heptose 1,7-bisphosphate phosphatase
MTARRFVVLDRDGTLIVERNYLSDPNDVELLSGVGIGLRRMRDLGLGLVIVTNQSGVGRGYFNMARLDQIHKRLTDLLRQEDVVLDGIYCCPHVPEDHCLCRKPQPGLLLRAATEHGFDPRRCVVVGDKPCDIDLGRGVGAFTILVKTGYGASFATSGDTGANAVGDDLEHAAQIIHEQLVAEPSS